MKSLIVITGPTGVGKTHLSLSAAEHLDTEIISADSRQMYRHMRIGTAAPTREELSRVPHHFVHTLELDDYYSAAEFETDALKEIARLHNDHDTVVLTGGSMMYIDAVTKGIDDIPTVDEATRSLLKKKYEEEGLDILTSELKMLDPDHYAKVDLKNHKRVIHALEICYQTGRPYSSFLSGEAKQRPFRIIKIGLRRERQELYERINCRVDQMVKDGLIDEARQLLPHRGLNSLNTVGYKEMFKYFDGEWTLEQAVEKLKRNTRIYAKKQMTWFKRDADFHWFHPQEEKEILQFIDKVVNS